MKPCVLLVEDDSDFAESVSLNLEEAGFRLVGPVAGGLEAFAVCEREQPDVALIDIGLEGMIDGIFLGEQLAERGVAVVYLTGRFERALREGRAHAAALLAKPCRSEELIATLQAALAARQPANTG
jgi:DNA-binding response OmpR family regulator